MSVILEILLYAVMGLFVLWYLVYVGKLITKLFDKSIHGDSTKHKT